MITGIPSVNKNEDGKDVDCQGIDRLINTMTMPEIPFPWRMTIICEPVTVIEAQDVQDNLYGLYENFQKFSKFSMQHGFNSNENQSKTESISISNSKTWGTNTTQQTGESHGNGASSLDSKGTNNGKTEGRSFSKSSSDSYSKGTSNSLSYEIVNKKSQEILKYLDEELLERMKLGNGKGLFKTSIYAMADNPQNLSRLKSAIVSIFQGNKPSFNPLSARTIEMDSESNCVKILSNFQNNITNINLAPEVLFLYGHPINQNGFGLSTYMTAKEISLIAGLPLKEVPGLILKEGVEFGLNTINAKENTNSDHIFLGNIIQRGQELKNNSVHLLKENLCKHIFVAGVTGSGKTTTCQKLLLEADLPFWVIEPAKTEYRQLFDKKGMEDILFFTLGNENLAPFRFNPFELVEGENLTSHVDMLKATFTTAFPMEASMPQILEESLYICYQKYGWDINTGRYINTEGKEICFPQITDLLEVMKETVKAKKFGLELQANYIGSLVSRISNLTVGSKGQMLNCGLSIDFNEIIDKKVIFEMDDLKSPEDKSLFMGLILSRMSEVLKLRHKKDKNFKHLTLIEEAHRLLGGFSKQKLYGRVQEY